MAEDRKMFDPNRVRRARERQRDFERNTSQWQAEQEDLYFSPELKRRGYSIDRDLILGRGKYGIVYKVVRNGIEYAGKVYDRDLLSTCEPHIQFKREALKWELALMRIFIQIAHPNIVRVFDVFESIHASVIIMELAEVSLAQVWSMPHLERLPIGQIDLIVESIGAALNYLHMNHLAHRALVAENVLLLAGGRQVKLGGFDHCKYCLNINTGRLIYATESGLIGTPYVPPEVLNAEHHDAMKADIWAFGVLIFRLLTGEFPFDFQDPQIHLMQTHESSARWRSLVTTKEIPPHYIDILERALACDWRERTSVHQLMSHRRSFVHRVPPITHRIREEMRRLKLESDYQFD